MAADGKVAIVAWHTLSRQGNYGLTYLVTPAPSSHWQLLRPCMPIDIFVLLDYLNTPSTPYIMLHSIM